ncbi:MAG: ABC transporter ATP-binding protein [Clostridia bacterium]|nr:ABC transporter ATP-binding protein [Clostridia bacterium]
MSETILELQNIRKKFQETEVLRGISLKADAGEFITLLGSSGCGKTTTLRIISGLETADSGRVILEGKDVTGEVPEKRSVNTVFQNYALFPHMNVGANIGYGLKIRKRKKAEIRQAVHDALELVQLPGFENRMPAEMSGGQRQRVAIARAIVNEPKVLLLDEPLGALDLQLRRQMQIELKRLQKRLGITFIYITHDQEEALNMSDRIAVMKNGVFQQIGTPSEIYDRPKNSYVASFVGSANILRGQALRKDGELWIRYAGGIAPVTALRAAPKDGESVTAAVRSEYIEFVEDGGEGIPARVKEKSFAAGMLRIALETENGDEIIASRHGIDFSLAPGDRTVFSFSREHAVTVEDRDEE